MSNTLVDVLPDLKAWLQSLNTLAGTRVFFRLPEKPSAAPFMRISRSGGAVLPDSEVPLSVIRVTIEAWGMANSDYDKVRQTVNAVEQAFHNIGFSPTPVGSGASTILWAEVDSIVDMPDPDMGWPRIVLLGRLGYKATAG